MFSRLLWIAKWAFLLPLLVVYSVFSFFLDQLLPRYVCAAILLSSIAFLWYAWTGVFPAKAWFGGSLIFGTILAGLWECCDMCSGRAFIEMFVEMGAWFWRKCRGTRGDIHDGESGRTDSRRR